MAAKRPSADADASHNLGLVADTNLAQLNPGFKYGGQILHQLTEIYPAVGGEIKQHLIVVECILASISFI